MHELKLSSFTDTKAFKFKESEGNSCVVLWQVSNYEWGIDYEQYNCMFGYSLYKKRKFIAVPGRLSAGRADPAVVVVLILTQHL